MALFARYSDATDKAAYPSKTIWHDCPVLEMLAEPHRGFHWYDSFESDATAKSSAEYDDEGGATHFHYFPANGSAAYLQSPLDTSSGAGNLVASNSILYRNDASPSGELTLKTGDEIGAASGLLFGGAGGAPFVIPSDGTGGKLWFEARFYMGDVEPLGIDDMTVFVGLAEPSATGAAFIADGWNDFQDIGALGFLIPGGNPVAGAGKWENNGIVPAAGDPDLVQVVSNANSEATALVGTLSSGGVIKFNTYVKMGFIYDPDAYDRKEMMRFYLNGVEVQSVYVGLGAGDTTTSNPIHLAHDEFPGDVAMTPIVYLKGADNAETGRWVTLDWWRFAQLH
jgi:hypothetical protein